MNTESTLRRWLLLDGLGATVSAVSLGLILPALDDYFGMPRIALIPLALIAAVFALTSIAGALQLLAISPALHLRRIAFANLSYCLLTAACLAYYRHTLLAFDYVYFVGEILLVTFLSLKELQIARKTATP
jgi:hypothetical protein